MKTNTDRPRAGCYLRISSDPDDKREGVDRQRDDTAIICELNGWQIADIYTDNDRSASNGKARPQWDRLLADVKAGKIDAIAAWDQDRNWRVMRELEDLRRFFDGLDRPIKLATTGQGLIDLQSPSGVLTAQIKTAVSEHEIAVMKVRMRRAARQKAERGIPQWRKAFGYMPYTGTKDTDTDTDTDTGKREPDPVTAPLVERAYAMILSGGSLKDIAAMLNEHQAYGLTGKPWTHSTVSMFLRKARNAGLREHNGDIVTDDEGQPVKGTWTPLVPETTWRAAQAILTAPDRAPGHKSVRRHLLTGLLQCGKCGAHLGGQWVRRATGNAPGRPRNGETKPPKQTERRIAYACTKCRGVAIRSTDIEPLVAELVTGRLAQPDAADLLIDEKHDETEAEKLRVQRQTLIARRNQIAVDLANGDVDGGGYRIAVEHIDRQIKAIHTAQASAERVRVFDQLPLGQPEVAAAVENLSPDRYRAIIALLMELTVQPVGKPHRPGFNPERVQVNWR